jgi:hypothetical protein
MGSHKHDNIRCITFYFFLNNFITSLIVVDYLPKHVAIVKKYNCVWLTSTNVVTVVFNRWLLLIFPNHQSVGVYNSTGYNTSSSGEKATNLQNKLIIWKCNLPWSSIKLKFMESHGQIGFKRYLILVRVFPGLLLKCIFVEGVPEPCNS